MGRRRQKRRKKAGLPVGNGKGRGLQMLGILLVILGFAVLVIPVVTNRMAEKRGSRAIAAYEAELGKLTEEQQEAMLAAAQEYNAEQRGRYASMDPFSEGTITNEEETALYESQLNVDGSGMMGYIRIPAIQVELPIWHGTSETALRKGAGHVMRTSLPVGGASTHAVLTAHRGLPGQALFTDLDQLGTGDIFYLKICGSTFAYEVQETLVVLPEETRSLRIGEGKDQVTLVTCTPYGINSHRLLVRGERIPYKEAIEKMPDEVDARLWIPPGILAAAAVLGAVVLVAAVWIWRRRSRRRKDG